MKKTWRLLAVLAVSCVLTGCGSELTDVQNRMIAEYAADLLLKYDANYQNRLLEDSEITTEATTEEKVTEEHTTEATEERSTENGDVSTQEPEVSTTENDKIEILDSENANDSDIAELVGIEGVSIKYSSCMFVDKYPSRDQDGAFIYLDADEGYKLVVVEFDITNVTSQDVTVDMLNTEIDYKLLMNGTKAAKPMLTILMDDLGTLECVVPAGDEQSAVLIFQMSDDMVDKINTLQIQVTYEEKEQTIHIK